MNSIGEEIPLVKLAQGKNVQYTIAVRIATLIKIPPSSKKSKRPASSISSTRLVRGFVKIDKMLLLKKLTRRVGEDSGFLKVGVRKCDCDRADHLPFEYQLFPIKYMVMVQNPNSQSN